MIISYFVFLTWEDLNPRNTVNFSLTQRVNEICWKSKYTTFVIDWISLLATETVAFIIYSNMTVPFELSQTKDFQRALWANKSPRAFYPFNKNWLLVTWL